MPRPLIGITGQLEAAHWDRWVREAVLSPVSYTRAVERAGGTPLVLPPVPAGAVASLVAGLHGLVLTGGKDVDPGAYGALRHEQTDPPDFRRDSFEFALTRAAIDARLPVLAICRGMHVLNVVRDGTLIQHLPEAVGHTGHAPDPVKMTTHDVQLSGGSMLGKIFGSQARVPALHHQAVQRAGSGLLPVAWAQDQVIEAIELQGHPFAIGVQWHPEEGDDLRLFEALVAAARERSQRGGPGGPAPGEPGAAGKRDGDGENPARDAGRESSGAAGREAGEHAAHA
ncbi:MAG TPA: gamma-glutamyl-gamma-aminobutyrate hydrolase family protein [Streptosporangiaceae bacterium]|nr:gamma-glutamyl-gamma-aminobutyrate hydrolase family protein [Streptosporangiaceae bacterium]